MRIFLWTSGIKFFLLLFCLLFLTFESQLLGQNPKKRTLPETSLECTVVDEDELPIEGVRIFAHSLFNGVSGTEFNASPIAMSDRSGQFFLSKNTDEPMGLATFLVAEDKMCDILSSAEIGNHPLRVQLKKDTPIPVVVIDEMDRPVEGALVAPCKIDFPDEFWIEELSPAVMSSIATSTDASGKANIRGTAPKHMQSACVNLPGKGEFVFSIPNQRDQDIPLRFRIPSHQGKLRCRMVDHQGNPVTSGALHVTSPPESSNRLSITEPTVMYSKLIQVDEKGECLLENIPTKSIDVVSFFFDHRGYSSSKQLIPIRADETAEVEIKLLPSQSVHFSVLDTSMFEGHAGIKVVFRKQVGSRYLFATGLTDDEGNGTVELEIGDWDVEIQHLRTLPEGYILANPVETQKISIQENKPPKPLPPFLIVKGRWVEGSIEGVDFESLRSDWVIVTLRGSSGEEKEYWGKHELDGKFRVALPEHSTDDQIQSFEISHAPITNRRKLQVLSREPFRLLWKEEKKTKDQ